MGKHTKKVGIVGKYGTRYGSSLRKQAKKFEVLSHSRFCCPFCGKLSAKREAVGIWKCKACKKTMAGGAWQMTTNACVTARSTVGRLRKMLESEDA
ncbi:MAG: hypothetical protein KVP17_004218 [Porospora cf. gigantea B]|uniref:uncharacterized protein n=1 Tax=Porospora cf. gigantea A TaxID=2853593 RepID=UPI00355AB73B|nr:MAG: hypothetical protein KVP18_002523 [Porospora cf. gigantea A]KAH0482427.1 MAG: hypothetical protein KVP17_004218 [Porospora cf. gigantea B]